MQLVSSFAILSVILATSIAAPRRRNREWRFSGASGSLIGREDQPVQSETHQFGNSKFTSHSLISGKGGNRGFDLESFMGFGNAPTSKMNSIRVPEEATEGRPIINQPIVESESSATANQGAVSAGSISGITGGTELDSLDLDSFAGVNEKEGYGHSSSRAVGNAATHNRARKSQVPEQTLAQASGDDHSVATVGASASAAKGTSDRNKGDKGDSFWDNYFISTSHLSSGSAGESKISGRMGGFGGDSGSFGITFEDSEE